MTKNFYNRPEKVYKYKQWKYGYHRGVGKFVFEPLDRLFEREGIELSPTEKFELSDSWIKEFPYNFETLRDCKMYLSENENEIFEQIKERINEIKEK